jgi:hypothetical protein
MAKEPYIYIMDIENERDYLFEPYYSRYATFILDIMRPFSFRFDAEDAYAFHGGFHIFTADNKEEKRGKIIGYVKAAFLKDDYFSYSKKNVVDFGDMIDANLRWFLFESTHGQPSGADYPLEEFEDKESLHICYVKEFYVHSEFREPYILGYLCENLPEILSNFFKVDISSIIVNLKTAVPAQDSNWINLPDIGKSMHKSTKSMLKNNGYKRIGRLKAYVKICV